MTLKTTLTFMSFAAMIAGCDTAETAAQSDTEQSSALAPAGKTVLGDARMASFSAPKTCEKVSLDTMRMGGSTRVRSGCIVRSGDATVVVGLNEITVPFNQAFSVSGGGAGDFQQAAAAFPREMLSEYVVKSEKSALTSSEPGWRYSNKKSNLLSGNGGVEGASACVQFSFNGVSTGAPSQKKHSHRLAMRPLWKVCGHGSGGNARSDILLSGKYESARELSQHF